MNDSSRFGRTGSAPINLRAAWAEPFVLVIAAGKYLEIFARKNNLRNFWVSVGNEVSMRAV